MRRTTDLIITCLILALLTAATFGFAHLADRYQTVPNAIQADAAANANTLSAACAVLLALSVMATIYATVRAFITGRKRRAS